MSLCAFVSRFWRQTDAGVATIVALSAPLLLVAGGVATEYASMSTERGKLQAAADAAVLAGARELRFANADLTAGSTPRRSMRAARSSPSSAGTVPMSGPPSIRPRTAVEVVITRPYAAVFGLSLISTPSQLQVRAVGKVGSGVPICLIGLEMAQPQAIWLKTRAQLTAPGCAVYSNSSNAQGMVGLNFSNLSAQVICSAGGKVGAKANFTPIPSPIARNYATRSPPVRRPPSAAATSATWSFPAAVPR